MDKFRSYQSCEAHIPQSSYLPSCPPVAGDSTTLAKLVDGKLIQALQLRTWLPFDPERNLEYYLDRLRDGVRWFKRCYDKNDPGMHTTAKNSLSLKIDLRPEDLSSWSGETLIAKSRSGLSGINRVLDDHYPEVTVATCTYYEGNGLLVSLDILANLKQGYEPGVVLANCRDLMTNVAFCGVDRLCYCTACTEKTWMYHVAAKYFPRSAHQQELDGMRPALPVANI